jgi:arsenate reductase
MKNEFICYPKCTTCQKAKKFLDGNKVKYEERHIVTETPSVEELNEIIKKSGLSVNKLFNTSGMLYRSMNLKEELKSLTDEEMISLLASNGMLIKRPIFISNNKILVGFKEDEWKNLIK